MIQQIIIQEKLNTNDINNVPLFYFISSPSIPCLDDKESNSSISKVEENNKNSTKILERKKKRQNNGTVKIHGKFNTDNIITKIKVNSLNCIREAGNSLLKCLGYDNNTKFIDINYKEKRSNNKKQLKELKESNIEKILCQKVSDKFRKQSKEFDSLKNNFICEQVKENEAMKQFLSLNFIKFFRDVFLTNKKYINLNGKNFELKVKTYKDLLNKNGIYDEEDENRKKMDKVIQNYYLNLFKVK